MRVGLLGTGGIGAVHANQYAKCPDVELWAFDLNAEKLRAFCERFQARPATSRDELLSACDAIDACLPTDAHLDAGLAAIAAGKALLMEKPLAATPPEAEQLVAAAARTGVPLMTAQVVRFFPEFRLIHDKVRSGAIGTPAVARTRRGGRLPMGEGGWFRDVARSGGVLLDLCIHDFDWLRWTLGEVTSVVSRSVALARGSREFVGDYALTLLTFSNGSIAHVEGTWMDPAGFRTTVEVCGSEGMLAADSRPKAGIRLSTTDATAAESPLAPDDDPYYRQIRGFLDAVKLGQPMPVPAEDGLRAVVISHAALESARSVQPVRLG